MRAPLRPLIEVLAEIPTMMNICDGGMRGKLVPLAWA